MRGRYFMNAELPRSDKPESYKFIPFGTVRVSVQQRLLVRHRAVATPCAALTHKSVQGLRMCVGFGLGRIIMVLKAAAHFHAFRWESMDGSKLDLVSPCSAVACLVRQAVTSYAVYRRPSTSASRCSPTSTPSGACHARPLPWPRRRRPIASTNERCTQSSVASKNYSPRLNAGSMSLSSL
jgi:hypothetical protein